MRARIRGHPASVKIIEADITDLSHDGRGVARVEGKATFVTRALPGERVRARVTRRRRSFDEAQTQDVLQAAPERVEPRCQHFDSCGGCALQHMDAAAQIRAKERVLLESLQRIGDVTPQSVLPALTAEPWGYRRKARLSVRWVAKKGRVLVGFREEDSRFVADIRRCEVLVPQVGERIEAISDLLQTLDARQSIAQIEVAAGDTQTALVFRNMQPLGDADLDRLRAFARATGLAVMLQPGGIDSVTALEPAAVDLHYALPTHGLRLDFLPLDFVQVNAAINAAMVDHALGLLTLAADDRVLDLFSGLGNFTLPMARHAAQVTGVEGEHGLVARAMANAHRNGLDARVDMHVANLAEDQHQAAWARRDYDKVLLDPPRSGAEAVLEYLPGRSVQRIVYVSCHPASLARDAGILVRRHGFQLRQAGVMDMFPHTGHVESIALFER
jgi:23S rRNA (uracil1939-C5)-methyltransferase